MVLSIVAGVPAAHLGGTLCDAIGTGRAEVLLTGLRVMHVASGAL
jgi:hypothetical protein